MAVQELISTANRVRKFDTGGRSAEAVAKMAGCTSQYVYVIRSTDKATLAKRAKSESNGQEVVPQGRHANTTDLLLAAKEFVDRCGGFSIAESSVACLKGLQIK